MIRSMFVCFLMALVIVVGCGTSSKDSDCQEGDLRPCACTDGSIGSQACLDLSWSDCVCQSACQEGATQDCLCSDGSLGAQTCLDGSFGDCECAEPVCQTGETRDCNCPDGSPGSQNCAEGDWDVCKCAQPDCQTGQQQTCTCPDGQSGSQTCAEGLWGSCQCQAVHPVDLRGTFASLNVASTYSESIIGEVNSTTVIISRMEFEQSGNQLVSTGKICTIELDSGTSFLTTIFPDSFIDALTTEPRPAHLEETEDGIKFVGTEGVELRGVHLDDPKNDPLPTDPDDPRIWDQDGDGQPGLTVTAEGIIDGDMYIIQRDVSTWTGEVSSADRVEGLLTFENQMVIVAATNDLLLQGNEYDTWQDPVADNSYLVFQRIDPSYTCERILAEREVLFE